MAKEERSQYSWGSFFELIRKTKPHVGLFTVACIISSASAILSTFIPNVLKIIIDSYSFSGSLNRGILIGLVAIFVCVTITGVLSSYLLSKVGLTVVANLRGMTWTKIVKLPTAFFDKNQSGDIASRLVSDTTVIYNLVTHSFSTFINAVLTILFCGFWLFYYSWELSLVIVAAIPIFLLFFIPLGRALSDLSKKTQKSTGRLNVSAIEMISENKLVKSFTAENYQIDKGLKNINDLMQLGLKQAKWSATVNPFLNMIMLIIIMIIIGYGGVQLANGRLTVGTFIAFLTLIFYIINPISNFGFFFSQLQKTKGATERILQLLSEEEENINEGKSLDLSYKDIEISNLSFKYNTQENLSFSLEDITLNIRSGNTYALVGPSGSGKTTFVSLLERFYKPTSGSIYIDGESIENYSLHSWRSQIGYVSQEHSLITGTIRENLTFGLEPQDEEKIIEACEMAYAWEFIGQLPNGLDTHIGERGLHLSGGQRQRIAIARMFLKDPKIILLDEATSNLDSQSEEKVQSAMKKIIEGRTAIVIAHRLSTIMDSEYIIFVEDGKVTGQGTHYELQRTHKLYQQFCELQFSAQLQ